ncbi:Sec-independent protein translocase protein (TatC) [Propionibacterium ruminifibrarum]|uniref:Sec-independent protein translocase protein TatC n=1 Tax=Propionibacterium ruminifibrarum TaxID=1962131 RepID=A0A375I6Q5_9ACTN|nr:twin-arginine translocase subunit TatC [Propionibacterium ruminifibrarum]SPF68931.1 Sec-independent protein translocase protein (TatC) [Propionibacterium ruminifibrarum]
MATSIDQGQADGAAHRKRKRRHILPESWRPPEIAEDGSMELVDHLRELRYRILVSIVALIVAALCCFVFFDQLIEVFFHPINTAIATYQANNPEAQVAITTSNITGGFRLWMKIPVVAGFILSCPVWLYQLWRFIAPGLLANERKAALTFLGPAVPLFLAGIVLGYWVCPKGFAVLLEFNPSGVTNLNDANEFLTFEITLLLVFGLSFLLPVVLVMLDKFGLITGAALGKYRSIAVFGCFLFAAVATPSTDPISMAVLAVPMSGLYVVAEIICKRNDKRRAGRLEAGSAAE